VLAAIAAAALKLYGASRAGLIAAVAGLGFVSLAWLPATRRWSARGHLCWTTSVFLFITYLTFVLNWTFASQLGPASLAGGILLWGFELFAALLACAYLWELCDALGTERWRRRITRETDVDATDGAMPFVSLHVPAHNEPPDLVIETLSSLLRIDYPRYEIIAIDDNTADDAAWRPVKEWCLSHGVKFAHLQDWPGYKSGALNYALNELTDPQAEVIGVVDSDYQIHPGFLRRCAPLFADAQVGFIQAPQDYRDWSHASYYRRLYYSYMYFFAVSQPSRNERNGAIFAGTMGLIRRAAIERAGGWDEWCITEDAELSLRLMRDGWSGLHVDQSWGKGVMPLTFEALKSQRYRWCFGGIQILRMHWRSLLPGRRTRSNHLTLGQRWSYLAGGIQWYGDLLNLVFYLFLLAGAANLADGGGQLFRKLTPFLVATVPVLVGLGLVRAIALLRRGTGATWRDALGAFFVWQSTGLAVARASVQGLFARRAAFLRTPKTSETMAWWKAVGANWPEATLAALGVASIAAALTRTDTFSGPLLAGLLVFPTLGLAAAPFNSVAAQRAALPADLRRRRRTEWLRNREDVSPLVQNAIAGGTALTLAAVAAVVALFLVPSPHPVQPPRLFGPGSGQNPAPRHVPGGSGAQGGASSPRPSSGRTGPAGSRPAGRAPSLPATPAPSSAGVSPSAPGTVSPSGSSSPSAAPTTPARPTPANP
jgi:glycosyltransferase involved in cell wall biosynthesis